MNKNLITTLLVVATVAIAIASRFLDFMPNFSPIWALAMFTGAFVSNRYLSYGIPISVMLLSDWIIGFYPSAWAVYLGFFTIVFFGRSFFDTAQYSKSSMVYYSFSMVFYFLITNFAVWLEMKLYAFNLNGLINCYIAAIPFYKNSMISTFIFGSLLFGLYKLLQTKTTNELVFQKIDN